MASIPALIILFAIGVGLFFGFGILAATFDRMWGPVRGGPHSHVSLQNTNPLSSLPRRGPSPDGEQLQIESLFTACLTASDHTG
jgi:hypothetical protein